MGDVPDIMQEWVIPLLDILAGDFRDPPQIGHYKVSNTVQHTLAHIAGVKGATSRLVESITANEVIVGGPGLVNDKVGLLVNDPNVYAMYGLILAMYDSGSNALRVKVIP